MDECIKDERMYGYSEGEAPVLLRAWKIVRIEMLDGSH